MCACAWHSLHTVFNTFICYFVAVLCCSYPLLIHLLFASSSRCFEQRQTTHTHTHTLIQTNSPTKKQAAVDPKCRPAFKMNSVIHSLFHIILPNIRYTQLNPHSPHSMYDSVCVMHYVCVSVSVSGTVFNAHTMAYYYSCVAITILRLKTNCINQYVLFMRMRVCMLTVARTRSSKA